MPDAPEQGAWYYTAGESQCGPVEFERLRELARGGELNPRSDMVWGPGLSEWKRAGEVDNLFEKRSADEAAAAPQVLGAAGLPGAMSPDQLPPDVEPWHPDQEWPGVNRRSYFFAVIVVPVLAQVVLTVGLHLLGDALGQSGQGIVSLSMAALVALVGLWAAIQRFPKRKQRRTEVAGQPPDQQNTFHLIQLTDKDTVLCKRSKW